MTAAYEVSAARESISAAEKMQLRVQEKQTKQQLCCLYLLIVKFDYHILHYFFSYISLFNFSFFIIFLLYYY